MSDKSWHLNSRLKYSKFKLSIDFCDNYSKYRPVVRTNCSVSYTIFGTIAWLESPHIVICESVSPAISTMFYLYYVHLGGESCYGDKVSIEYLLRRPCIVSVAFWAIKSFNKVTSKI